jgi:hypothetical protein
VGKHLGGGHRTRSKHLRGRVPAAAGGTRINQPAPAGVAEHPCCRLAATLTPRQYVPPHMPSPGLPRAPTASRPSPPPLALLPGCAPAWLPQGQSTQARTCSSRQVVTTRVRSSTAPIQRRIPYSSSANPSPLPSLPTQQRRGGREGGRDGAARRLALAEGAEAHRPLATQLCCCDAALLVQPPCCHGAVLRRAGLSGVPGSPLLCHQRRRTGRWCYRGPRRTCTQSLGPPPRCPPQ